VVLGWVKDCVCEEGGRTFEYYVDAGDVKKSVSKRQKEGKKRGREAGRIRCVRTSNEGIHVTTPCKRNNQQARIKKIKIGKDSHTLPSFRPTLL
jgi:hypothetical protein